MNPINMPLLGPTRAGLMSFQPALGPSAFPARVEGPTFADFLKNAVSDASHLQDEASRATQAFARGENVEMHQVMAAMEEAALSMEFLTAVQSKFMELHRTLTTLA